MKASPSRQTHSTPSTRMRHFVRIGRDEPEVIAQRTGKGIAMRAELAAGRQHGEHRAVHRRDRIQELDRLRAQRARRRKKVVIPFQVKPLPAALEERIKAPVVVLGGGADKALVEQPHRLLANRLPVLAELCQFRKARDRDHRLVRNRRARIHQHIVGREIGRVIAELARNPKPLAAAEVNVERRCDEDVENDELWREKLL
jgi:hypothetical protein